MAGKGVREIVRHALMTGHGSKRGPWRVSVSTSAGGGPIRIGVLHHYGTAMLEWEWDPMATHRDAIIRGTWTGHGSVSDQTGVNAALDALGSRLHYYRDSKGGGPRVNPYSVGAGVGGSIRSVSPPTYNPQGTFPPVYNPRRRRRR